MPSMVAGTFVNLNVPPFHGKVSLIQSSGRFSYDDEDKETIVKDENPYSAVVESPKEYFIKYTVLVEQHSL